MLVEVDNILFLFVRFVLLLTDLATTALRFGFVYIILLLQQQMLVFFKFSLLIEPQKHIVWVQSVIRVVLPHESVMMRLKHERIEHGINWGFRISGQDNEMFFRETMAGISDSVL